MLRTMHVLIVSALCTLAVASELPSSPAAAAVESNEAVSRGVVVYARYCANCHGMNADGNGRAARLYNPKPANLRISKADDAYKEWIIKRGGAAVGRSEFMPPWQEELSGDQVNDVVAYLKTVLGR
jgi:mono/diheme cytochrome c family protein